MSLYAIGDLHLHFQSKLKAYDQIHNPVWKRHEKRFRKYCSKIVKESDTLVLAGDHSWGRKLEECEQDLQYIMDLPGKKILLRGNHDMFWDAKKTSNLNKRFGEDLFFLQDNYASYNDYAIVGTKGYVFEGPFYLDYSGNIVGWDEQNEEHSKKLVNRELKRLRTSFEMAKEAGYSRFIMFLHYPPTSILEERSGFTDMAEEYGAEKVIYAHCHGESRFDDSIHGHFRNVEYQLVSGDFLMWKPLKIIY